jgi:hypothetical protein
MSISGWIPRREVMRILGLRSGYIIDRLVAEGRIHRVRSSRYYVYNENDARRLVGQNLKPTLRRGEKGRFITKSPPD